MFIQKILKDLKQYYTDEEINSLFADEVPPLKLESITLNPKQEAIFKSIKESSFHIFSGATRSGKTYLASFLFINFVIENDSKDNQTNIYIASGRTTTSIRTNFVQILDKLNFTTYTLDLSKNVIYIGKSKILLFGASDVSSFTTVRGLTATGWYANEVTLHDEGFVAEAHRRVSTNPKLIIWDCNPTTPNHYIYKNWITNKELSKYIRHHAFSIYDNIDNLPDTYIQEQKASSSEREQRLYLDGEWVGEGINPFNTLRHIDYSMNDFFSNKSIKIAFLDPAIDIHLKNKQSSNTALAIIFETRRYGEMVDVFFGYVFKGGYQLHLSNILNIIKQLKIDFFYYENNLIGERVIEMSHEASRHNIQIASIRNTQPKLSRIANLLVPIEKGYLLSCGLGDEEFIHNVKNAELSEKSSVKLDAIDALESGYSIVRRVR